MTLHARTTEQGYGGRADYEAIAKLKSTINIPVIGNGDVVDYSSFQNMLATGVDGVMIGRGAQGRPWIFSELLKRDLSTLDKFKVITSHISTLRKYYTEDWLVLYMRKHLLWYTSGEKNSSEYRLKLATSPSIEQSLEILKSIF